jgi:hypothetical protein
MILKNVKKRRRRFVLRRGWYLVEDERHRHGTAHCYGLRVTNPLGQPCGAPSPAPLPKCNVFCPPITIKEEFIIEEIRGMPYITTGLPNGGRTQFFTSQYDSALTQARGLDFGK